MKTDIEFANAIHEKTRELSALIGQATAAGLEVELNILKVRSLSGREQPVINAKVTRELRHPDPMYGPQR